MTQRASGQPSIALFAVLAVLLGVAGYLGWPYLQRALAPEPVPVAAPPEQAAPELPVAPAEVASEETAEAPPSGPEHPIEPETTAAEDQRLVSVHNLDDSDPLMREQLAALFSRKDVLDFFQLDGVVRRIVATVDNLGRPRVPARIWPVNPTPGRFATIKGADGTETIDPDNSRRYAPWVRAIEAVDTEQAFRAYRRLYPLFQQAYEELGYPGRYFNDRLVQVLDLLIATPVHDEPLVVTLVEVKGPVPSLRPWVRYEFADPALASLSAGQRMLLRMGPDHQRRLQAKMRDIRARVD